MRALPLLLAFAAAPAAADVVMPPPDACPPGAIGMSGHMGPYCAPTRCEVVAECDAYRGWRHRDARFECAPAGLCVRRREAFAGRGGRVELTFAAGACATDAECEDGVPCAWASRCRMLDAPERDEPPPVPREPFAPADAGSCGAGTATTVGLLVVLLAAGLFAGRRVAARRGRAAALAHLLARGVATQTELRALTRSDAELDRALAPVAARVRVFVDDEGELVYGLDELTAPEERTRTDTRT